MSTKTAVRPKIIAKLGKKIALDANALNANSPNAKVLPSALKSKAFVAPVYDYAKLSGFFFKCFRVESVVTSFDGLLLTFKPVEQRLNKKDLLNRFEVSNWVCACGDLIEKKLKKHVKEVRASHNALWLRYDFDVVSPSQLLAQIEKLLNAAAWKMKKGSKIHLDTLPKKMVRVPVYFGSEGALDLKEIFQVLPLREKDFVSRCTAKPYRVCAFSFNRGMAVLDELDEGLRIRMKDLSVNEGKIPAGSVVAAENFIAITLFDQHGDWKVIGRVCTDLLKERGLPIFSRGDQLSFVSVGKADFSRYLREKSGS